MSKGNRTKAKHQEHNVILTAAVTMQGVLFHCKQAVKRKKKERKENGGGGAYIICSIYYM